jgi:hypothetical protein
LRHRPGGLDRTSPHGDEDRGGQIPPGTALLVAGVTVMVVAMMMAMPIMVTVEW